MRRVVSVVLAVSLGALILEMNMSQWLLAFVRNDKVARPYKNLHRRMSPVCEPQNATAVADVEGVLTSAFRLVPQFSLTGNHGKTTNVSAIVHVQGCQYAAVQRFKGLAAQFNISRWTVIAGSAIGLFCYNAMVPWDDDIDLAVDQCSKLDAIWGSAEPGAGVRGDKRHRARRLDEDWDILQHKWFILNPMYKLRSRHYPEWRDIGGIDIDCLDRFSIRRATGDGVPNYVLLEKGLQMHEFGPVTVQAPSLDRVKWYLRQNTPPPEHDPPYMHMWCLRDLDDDDED